jgi:3-oxo-5alpha-steroid 4-dehydrogenase
VSTRSISAVAPVQASGIGSWAAETDVLVVGFGAAGASAAIEAAAAGAEVDVIDAAGGWGGATGMSGGEIYLGGGTPIQKACGVEDTPEAMHAFLSAATGPGADEDKLAVTARGTSSISTGWCAAMSRSSPGCGPSRPTRPRPDTG